MIPLKMIGASFKKLVAVLHRETQRRIVRCDDRINMDVLILEANGLVEIPEVTLRGVPFPVHIFSVDDGGLAVPLKRSSIPALWSSVQAKPF
ncbi:hypothetical protein ACFSQ7_03515 [Paenibacillus rhizoplanae]